MKPGIPWSVKGIEPEVREAAKHAARRSGMTLGEWLNSVILDQADDLETPAAQFAAPPQKDFSGHPRASLRQDDTTIRLEDIAQQLTRLARREQESAAIRSYEPSTTREHDTETLNRILSRIEDNERQSVEAFGAVNERLSVLGRQIAVAERQKTIEKPEDVPGFKAIETAIRNVVDHIETSETRTREQLKAMQDRLGGMAQRATGTDVLAQTAPAIASLEGRLEQLATRVQRSEAMAQSGLPDLVRDEVSRLAERIETVRETSKSLAHQAQSAAVSVAQKELHEIEARILNLLNEAQSALGSQSASNGDLQRLRSEIGTLNQRIDDARSGTASERDVNALRVAVEQLSTRVAQGADMRPLVDMDRRLGEITHRLEHSPQLGELEQRIVELDHRLLEAVRLQGDGQALVALEQQIAAVGERVERTEKQLGNVDTIERAIQQLFEGLEQSRGMAREVAEDAASRVADRLLAASPQQSAGPSPELQALEEGLKAVRESAATSDQRSQETLEAVHETLEQIVNKLAELETAAAGHQLAVQLSQQSKEEPASAPPWQPVEKQNAEQQFFDPAEALQHPVFDPQEALAHPASAEPAVPDFRSAEPAPESLPVDFSAADGVGPAVGDDFIAAARRAAQVAATKPNVLAPENKPVLKKGANSKFKLSLPFKKGGKTKPVTYVNGKQLPEIKPAAADNSRRRTLLLAGLVLLVAVGAFTFNMVMKPAKPPKQSSAIETIAPVKSVAETPRPKTVTQDKVGLLTPKTQVGKSALPPPNASPPKIQPEVTPADAILTGALPAKKTEASLTSIVAEPGSMAERAEAPPAEIGAKSLRDAAVRGDATAQFIVASRYLDGQGVQQDFTKAAYWYQLAAAQGLAPAQYRIATLFERGKGVPQDPATALLWYERAATGGNVKSMHNAAVIAAGNQTGTPNYDKAFKWFREAAGRGLKDSQFNLAVLYERGLGNRIDKSEAMFWYTLAAKQGDQDAEQRLAELAKSLTQDAVAAITQRVASWKPAPSVDDANVVAIADQEWKSPGGTVEIPVVESASGADPVKTAQELLVRLGFNVGEPDGKMGTRTANAIRLFQLQSGLKVTGEVTPDLLVEMQKKAG